MRSYQELSPEEQKQAQDNAAEILLSAIVEGAIRFNDEANHDDLQARIDRALQKADDMQVPWFAGSYVYDAIKEEIDGMALCDAEDAVYPDKSERIIRL